MPSSFLALDQNRGWRSLIFGWLGQNCWRKGAVQNSLSRLMALCLLFSVIGCASLTEGIDPPKVTVESFRALPSDDIGPRFEVVLRVANPNKQTLDIVGISYTIEILDKELISGVTNEVPVIEPYTEELVTLEAGINMFQLVRLLAGLGRQPSDSLSYRLSAKIDFSGFIPTQRVTEEGVISL